MKKLLILHGALGSKEQLNPLREILKDEYEVYSLSFSGHGGHAVPDEKFTIALFANDVLTFLEEHQLKSINIFGYSMGGYVALYLSRFFPEKVEKICTLATKFDWSPATSQREASMLDPGTMEKKIPAFVQTLALRHGEENWKNVVVKTAEMMMEMGNKNPLTDDDFKKIKHHVMLSLGDQDKMVSMDETRHIQELIKNSEVVVLKNTPHPVEKVDTVMLGNEIRKFLR